MKPIYDVFWGMYIACQYLCRVNGLSRVGGSTVKPGFGAGAIAFPQTSARWDELSGCAHLCKLSHVLQACLRRMMAFRNAGLSGSFFGRLSFICMPLVFVKIELQQINISRCKLHAIPVSRKNSDAGCLKPRRDNRLST